jgi:hypothetical protein
MEWVPLKSDIAWCKACQWNLARNAPAKPHVAIIVDYVHKMTRFSSISTFGSLIKIALTLLYIGWIYHLEIQYPRFNFFGKKLKYWVIQIPYQRLRLLLERFITWIDNNWSWYQLISTNHQDIMLIVTYFISWTSLDMKFWKYQQEPDNLDIHGKAFVFLFSRIPQE